MSETEEAEANYFSKDFEWEALKQELENNPSYAHHYLPFIPSPQQQEERSEEDSKAWQSFHIRHSTGKFFKERRYLLKEFPELVPSGENLCKVVLEVGCGNGSSVIPILRGNKNIIVYACDCSIETLERAKEIVATTNIVGAQHRFHPFYCDFACTGFPKWLASGYCVGKFPHKQEESVSGVEGSSKEDMNRICSLKGQGCCIGGVDFVTLIFTLSAVPLKRMPTAIMECFSVLKPGGLLLFRDYGLYDMTMLRFDQDKRVGLREYMRADGTRSYFFCLETVRELFMDAGFIKARRDRSLDVKLADACISTTAAPLVFPPYAFATNNKEYNMVDGGVAANNPSLQAVCEAIAETGRKDYSKFIVLSLGTGQAKGHLEVGGDPNKWGVMKWLMNGDGSRPLLDILMFGPEEMAHIHTSTLFQASGSSDNYLRIQACGLTIEGSSIYDSSDAHLNSLLIIGKDILAKNEQKLIDIAQKLSAARKARLASKSSNCQNF